MSNKKDDKEFIFENDEDNEKVLGDQTSEQYENLKFDDTEDLESYLSDAVAEVTGEDEKLKEPIFVEEHAIGSNPAGEFFVPEKKGWSIKKKIFVGLGTTVATLALAVILVVGWFLFRINYADNNNMAATDLTPEELAAQQTLPPRDENQVMLDEKIINILLIGEEKIGSGNQNGRSDSMMIASMNTEDKTLKLVSIMRDSYVSIPGYRDNKLNAAFAHGGGELLADTIEQNFGIELDGYVRVDFAGFRKLIDELGGVEIELTEAEAQYLNTTNYISKKSERHMVPGKQTASGTQALGYCRVRKRAAINGENDDFGRTYRQRAVLSQIYEKVKDLNAVELISLVNTLLPYVSTNVGKVDILNYAKVMLQMGIPEVQQKRIPIDGAYTGQRLYCGASLVLDFDVNNKALWEFIYGDGVGDIITIHPSSGSDTSSYNQSTRAPYNQSTRAPYSQTTKAPYSPTRKPSGQTTKVPAATRKPTVTKAPTVTDAPAAPTKAPVVTKAPAPTKAPVVTKAPVITEAPSDDDDGSVG